MATRKKFRMPECVDRTIVDRDDEAVRETVVGHIRLKPSSIAWFPKKSQKGFRVPLDRFAEWIQSDGAAAAVANDR